MTEPDLNMMNGQIEALSRAFLLLAVELSQLGVVDGQRLVSQLRQNSADLKFEVPHTEQTRRALGYLSVALDRSLKSS